MNAEEFAARLAQIPEVEPDEIDLAMLEEAERINDDTCISLETFHKETAGQKSMRGVLSEYANPALREQEEGAWEQAAAERFTTERIGTRCAPDGKLWNV